MFKKPEPICPLLKSACKGDGCMFWVTIMGKNPQTGQDVNMPDCSFRWLPTLLIENSKTGRETGAAVESFRNETAMGHERLAHALLGQRDAKLIGGGHGA